MRLHRLKTHNLASLYGEQQVDFERDLASARLFLIVGQTGAGKSTLLDAISLALYGRTPRLGSAASSSSPDSVARIMSDGTGRCGVELEFSVHDTEGHLRRYRAAWTCWRARDRADGAVQKPSQTLEEVDADGVTLRVLAEGRKQAEFDAARDAVLDGLTFDELRRSMLLAQGEFAAFLKADEKERTAILERLTAVTAYRDIGRRAADRHRGAQERVRALRAQSDSVELLDADAITALERERDEARGQAAELNGRVNAIDRAQQWQTTLGVLERALAEKTEALDVVARDEAAASSDLARLQEHERCAPAKPALDAVDRAAEQAQASVAALAEATEAHEQARAVLVQRTEARDAARTALDARRVETAAVSEALPAARAAHEALRSALTRRDEAEKTMKRLDEEHAEQLQTTEKAKKKWRKATDALAEERKERLRLAVGGALDEAWDERVAPASNTYGAALLTWKQAKSAADRTADAAARAASARQGTHAKVVVAERRAAGASEALSAAQSVRTAALDGAASADEARSAWQAQIDEARARLATLEAVAAAAHAERKAAHERAERESELATRQAEVDAAGETSRMHEERVAGVASEVHAHEQAVRGMEQALRFVDARRELVDGEACPVCGATSHPAAGDDADGVALEERLKEQRAALDEAVSRLDDARNEQSRQHTRAIALREARAEAEGRVRSAHDAERAASAAARAAKQTAGFEDDDGFAFEAEQSAAARAQERANAALQRLADAERALEQARTAAEAQQPELAKARELAAEAKARAEAAQAEADRAASELAEARSELERTTDRFREVLVSLGVPVAGGEPGDLEIAAGDAVRLRRQWVKQGEVVAEAEKKAAERERRAHAEARVLDELTRALTPAREALRDAAQAAEHASTDVARHFGGRSPDVVEQGSRDAEAQARARFEAADAARAEAATSEAARASTVEERQAALLRAQEQLAAEQQALAESIAALGLADAAALRGILLDDDSVGALRRRREALETRRTQAAAAKTAAEQSLTAHRGEPVERCTEAAEVLAIAHEQARQTAEAAQRAVGALDERLRTQAQAREKLAEVASELGEAQTELALWARIHELIGRNDGDAFARLAQILNLAELVEHANERLTHLTQRYRLTVRREDDGRPTLDFAVRDAEQGDRERSVSTLSGGETFLVSLGLALSLADFRSTRLPIETLLLDEGFGTLDPDTLSVAMSALERLHQLSGASIGIISHVEALRERVDAQIVVETRGGGRSVVTVPSP